MTPGARVAAAIDLLDDIAAGAPAEKALTNWARANRYAGSKDRAAVRDHVFDALRRWRSSAWLGQGETGRARMIGLLRGQGVDLETLFSGIGHAPTPLSATEREEAPMPMPKAVRSDLPDWVFHILDSDLCGEALAMGEVQGFRAPVFLRVLTKRGSLETARQALAADGIETQPVAGIKMALKVTTNPRRVQRSAAYLTGLVELQDASAQALCLDLPLRDDARVMDYCAGGGGKILALADRANIAAYAHDAAPQRLVDLPARAARAGVAVEILASPDRAAPYDLVLCDAPCSGSGTWRRTPEAKWRLAPEDLDRLVTVQGKILDEAQRLVTPDGCLAYATCSLFSKENEEVVAAFCARNDGWQVERSRLWKPGPNGDGFYLAILRRGGD